MCEPASKLENKPTSHIQLQKLQQQQFIKATLNWRIQVTQLNILVKQKNSANSW